MLYLQDRQKQSFIIPGTQSHTANYGMIVRICLLLGSLALFFGSLGHVQAQTVQIRPGGTALYAQAFSASDLDIAGTAASGAFVQFNNMVNVTTTTTVTAAPETTSTNTFVQFTGAHSVALGTTTLDDGGTNRAVLFFLGSGPKTISGTINGAQAGEGVINIVNRNGVTFSDAIGNTAAIGQLNVVAMLLDSSMASLNGSGNHNLGVVTLDDDTSARRATLVFGASGVQTITSTIDGASADEGIVTITNSAGVIFNNAIGVTNAVSRLNLGSASASASASFIANVQANSIVLDEPDGTSNVTMTLSGTAAQTITGPITAAPGGRGAIQVTNTGGAVTFANTIGTASNRLRALTTNASTTTIFSAAVNANAVSLNGTVTFSAAGSQATTVTIANGTRIILGSAVGAGMTMLTASGTITAPTTPANAVVIEIPASFVSGTTTVLDGGAGTALNTNGFTLVTTNPLVSYRLALADSNRDLQVIAFMLQTTPIRPGGTTIYDQPFTTDNLDIAGTAASGITLQFNNQLTVTTATTVTAAPDATSGNAVAQFSGTLSITLATATLDDGGTNRAMLVFMGSGTQIVSGTIDGATANEEIINVTNNSATGTSFTGNIGGTNAIS